MFLVDGRIACRAVAFARRSVDKPLDAVRAAGFEDVESADDVGLHIGRRGDIGVRDGDEGGEMKDGGAALHGVGHEKGIDHIAADNFDLF